MVGRKLGSRLVADGDLGGRSIMRFTLADIVMPQALPGFSRHMTRVTADPTAAGARPR